MKQRATKTHIIAKSGENVIWFGTVSKSRLSQRPTFVMLVPVLVAC